MLIFFWIFFQSTSVFNVKRPYDFIAFLEQVIIIIVI